jgi:hypothetical protein
MAVVDNTQLHNLANIESKILPLKPAQPSLYLALHNLANVINTLIDSCFPTAPAPLFMESFFIPVPTTGVVPIAFQFKMPLSSNWTFNNLTLNQINATLSAAPTGSDVKVDIKVSQNKGTTAFKTILKTPIDIPVGLTTVKMVKFSIDTFSDGDLLEFDVTQIDSSSTGIGLTLYLQGSYNITSQTPGTAS